MKIIHFSDTHLGFSEYKKIDPVTGINQREQDFYNAWKFAVDAICDHQPDLVLHCGDLFHTTRPGNRAIAVAFEGIQKITDHGIPMVLISGNHSTPKIKATGSIFEAISLFPKVHAAYHSRYRAFKIVDTTIHCIPHCSLTEELEQAFAEVVFSDDSTYNILMTHGAWAGSKDFSMGEFNEQHIPNPELKMDRQFDYIALGHYHKHIRIADHIIYSGSTERTSFNEVNYKSGYVLIDPVVKTYEYIEIPSRNMIKLPAIDCGHLTASQIYMELDKLSTDDLEHALVSLELKNIQHDTFLKLDWREVDACFDQVFHLEKSFSHVDKSGTHVSAAAFESISVEFERYIDNQQFTDLDQERLKKTGLEYLNDD